MLCIYPLWIRLQVDVLLSSNRPMVLKAEFDLILGLDFGFGLVLHYKFYMLTCFNN